MNRPAPSLLPFGSARGPLDDPSDPLEHEVEYRTQTHDPSQVTVVADEGVATGRRFAEIVVDVAD